MHQSEPQPADSTSIAGVSANATVATEGHSPTSPEHRLGGGDSVPTMSPSEGGASDESLHYDSLRGDLVNVVRGFCMGAADTVPGISGGTIALILGHYSRLVTAISHVDGRLMQLVSRRDFAAAAKHLDLRFLALLGCGILTGIVALSGLMHYLLDAYLPETLAVFLGLLVASLWVVVQYVDRWTPSRVLACAIGAAVAALISSLPFGQGSMSLPFLFLAASVAICAMILPGISGAYVLLVLGLYHPITGLVKDLAKLQFTTEGMIQLFVFGLGCIFGLLAFSRVLRRLLQHSPGITMAALMGLMIGSARKLWPLQEPTPETADLEPKLRVLHSVWPADWSGSLFPLIALVILSASLVLAIEWIAAQQGRRSSAA